MPIPPSFSVPLPGEISLADIALIFRTDPALPAIGSGTAPFSFSALAPYSSNPSSPYSMSEWTLVTDPTNSQINYNYPDRFDAYGFNSSAYSPWNANIGDIFEFKLLVSSSIFGGNSASIAFEMTNSGIYKVLFGPISSSTTGDCPVPVHIINADSIIDTVGLSGLYGPYSISTGYGALSISTNIDITPTTGGGAEYIWGRVIRLG